MFRGGSGPSLPRGTIQSPMKRAANTPTRNRPRKKAVASQPDAALVDAPEASETPEAPEARNVDPLEGAISVGAGVLFLVAALFPRSIKQLLMLSIGGGLLYRGMTGHCPAYKALGVDTAKEPLLQTLNEKFLALK